MSKKNIAISACLTGLPCRYDGKSKEYAKIKELEDKYNLVLICPECLGGLPTPRIPSENVGDRVINQEGLDVTSYFINGAKRALAIYQENNCAFAVLKESSPSCGSNMVYDGTFSGHKIKGKGSCAKMFEDFGIRVYTEVDIDKLIKEDKDA